MFNNLGKIVMQAVTPKTLDFYIYDEIFSGYKYNWATEEVQQSETSAEYFKNALKDNQDVEQINIYINSIGGSVKEATGIYNLLKRHAANVTVYIDGFAASAASVIAMAGDVVIMPRNTVMMIHNALFQYVTGNAKELRKMADDLDVISNIAKQAYLLKAGDKLDVETIDSLLDAESYLTAEQCINYGLADKYADQDADIEKAVEMLKASEAGEAKQAAERIIKSLEGATHKNPEQKTPTIPQQTTQPEQAKEIDFEKIVNKFFKL